MVQNEGSVALEKLLELCTVKLNIPGKAGWGTGFFVAPGKILTCAHVVKDAGTQAVKVSSQSHEGLGEASVVGVFLDPFDIALLELKEPIPEHPCVYLDSSIHQERVIQSSDRLYTYGYPDDFPLGAPVTTACEGLTGDSPPIIKFKQGQIRPGLSGSPLLNQRTSKVCGIVKFTRDRSNDLGGGAVPVAAILSKFSELGTLQNQFHKQNRQWVNLLPKTRCHPRVVASISIGIAIAVGVVRFLGILQPVELKIYDHLMQTRLGAGVDDRIRIVEIGVEDVAAQRERDERLLGSLSHESLLNLLTKLVSSKPRVIGMDLYRENQDFLEEHPELIRQFQSQPNLIGVCKANDDEKYQVSGIEPPPRMPENRVGFSDFILDGDDVLRRQILAFQPPEGSPCSTQISFGLQVAGHYLEQENIFYDNPIDSKGACHSLRFSDRDSNESRILPNLLSYTGGYQYQADASYGCQVLLNYQANRQQFTKTFTLEQVLTDQVKPEEFRDKIVLIGVTHRDNVQDYWNTPYGVQSDQEMPGVMVQAQMVSQIIGVATGERSLIWVMPQWAEWLWIIAWSTAGGFLGWRVRSPRSLGIGIAIAGASLYIICLASFQFNGWLPLLPPLLGVGTSGVVVWWINLQGTLSYSFNRNNPETRSKSVEL
ncbi:CHASE2 domain-containing protein [Cyanobacteria bacterium FACHB-471]|nr:CHASE2 domain-containing protein [Cyanobacteria bacterium FACHB-471]